MRTQVMAENSTKTANLADAHPNKFGSESQSAQEYHRAAWYESRSAREQKNTKSGIVKRRSKMRAKTFNFLFGVAAKLVKAIGLHDHLANRAAKLVLTELDFHFHDLPPAFDGYRILHISDPHFDSLPQLEEAMLAALDGRSVDIAVVTGDIADQFNGPWKTFLPPMRRLISEIAPADGFYAVLGNHDSWRMVAPLEAQGVTMLINETAIIDKKGNCISLTGVDDPSNYYSPEADRALWTAPAGFKIALVHSAELADIACRAGHALYLAGHSHGGQISLPGGVPVMTGMQRLRKFSRGVWRHGGMAGYTSTGVGVSGMPYRLFANGEIALLTLRRKP